VWSESCKLFDYENMQSVNGTSQRLLLDTGLYIVKLSYIRLNAFTYSDLTECVYYVLIDYHRAYSSDI